MLLSKGGGVGGGNNGNHGNGNNGGGGSHDNRGKPVNGGGKGKHENKGRDNAIERGKGKKKGLYKLPNGKIEDGQGVSDLIVEVLNDLVNGERSPSNGATEGLKKTIMESVYGLKVEGMKYTYNQADQLIERET